MIDFSRLTKAELARLNADRQTVLGPWMIESDSDSVIVNELRLNYGFVFLRDCFFYGQHGESLELKINDSRRHIHLAYISVADKYRRQGLGSRTLALLVALADCYGYTIDLDIDTRFGTGKVVLVRFYQAAGFQRVGPRGSNRYYRQPVSS